MINIMSSPINENDTTLNGSTNVEKNINQINISEIPKGKVENKKESIPKFIIKVDLVSNNNSLPHQMIANTQNNERIKLLGKKKKIFKANKNKKKKRHDCYAFDNNNKIIIKHFVNFFLNFINLSITKGINKKIGKNCKNCNNDNFEFKIGYKLKERINVEDITTKTVEQFLKFNPKNNKINRIKKLDISKNSNMKFKDIKTSKNYNDLVFEKIKKDENLGTSFDNLFKAKVLDLFNDLYIKNRKDIDLIKYGIEGIKLNLIENEKKYETYDMLKKKYEKNPKKIEIFDNLISTKFVEPQQKSINFKIEKKE